MLEPALQANAEAWLLGVMICSHTAHKPCSLSRMGSLLFVSHLTLADHISTSIIMHLTHGLKVQALATYGSGWLHLPQTMP